MTDVENPYRCSTYWTQLHGMNTRYTVYEPTKDYPENVVPLTVLVVPGNPGNNRFYNEFCGTLMQLKLDEGQFVQIFSVCHANHILIDDDRDINYNICEGVTYDSILERSSIKYNLNEQVEHKVNFCRYILSPKCKGELCLVGHSIGAFICLQILPRLRDIGLNSIRSCFLLFPTVERMAETPHGRRLRLLLQFFGRFDFLTRFIGLFIEALPQSLKLKLCKWAMGGTDESNNNDCLVMQKQLLPECIIDAAVELFRTNVIRNIIYMCNHELNEVVEFDESLLLEAKQNTTQVTFFYGINDNWSPLSFAREMLQRVKMSEGLSNIIKVLLDDQNTLEHAFVVHGSREMAEKLHSIMV